MDRFLNPQPKTISELFEKIVGREPFAVACQNFSHEWSYQQIENASNRAAQGLKALQIPAGARVATLTKCHVSCLILTLAAAKMGAVCTPLNWRLAAPELEFILGNSEAQFVLVDQEFLFETPFIKNVVKTEDFAEWREEFNPDDPGCNALSEDTALQIYSSGTTGLPKGVELSHSNLLENVRVFTAYSGFNESSVVLNALPTFHISGVGLALNALLSGGKSVFLPKFEPLEVLRSIERHRITHLFLVPTMMQLLLGEPGIGRIDLSSLELIVYGGSPSSESLLSESTKIFGCGFVQTYGLTETTAGVVFSEHADLLRSAGRPCPGTQIRIASLETGKPLSDGEVGEIWIRSKKNMKGYWKDPESTRLAFPEGRENGVSWFRTGDAGYLRDGYLYLTDRIKDIIISGGENIYPAEIERVLLEYPDVLEAAVIGVSDEKWGESVKAFVVLNEGSQIPKSEILAFVAQRISKYKCPKSLAVLNTLPRNSSGKVDKKRLRGD